MFKIPDTYYQNNEDYITLPVIREFVDKYLDGKFRRDNIIFEKANLLECMLRKMDAVKLDVTKDLAELKLYSL